MRAVLTLRSENIQRYSRNRLVGLQRWVVKRAAKLVTWAPTISRDDAYCPSVGSLVVEETPCLGQFSLLKEDERHNRRRGKRVWCLRSSRSPAKRTKNKANTNGVFVGWAVFILPGRLSSVNKCTITSVWFCLATYPLETYATRLWGS